MLLLVAKRVLIAFATIVAVIILAGILIHIVPGDPVTAMMAQSVTATPEVAPAPVEEPVVAKAPARKAPLQAKKAAKKAAPAKRNRKAPQELAPETPVGAILSWVEPVGDVCPPSHPIKAKLGSRVFRRPGAPGYENSRPDRCYASEGAARRGGFNEAQR